MGSTMLFILAMLAIWALIAVIVYASAHFLVPRHWIQAHPIMYGLALAFLVAPGMLSGGHAAVPVPVGARLMALFSLRVSEGELFFINVASWVIVGLLICFFESWRQKRAAASSDDA
jgi:hypothetical protein